MKSHFHHPFFTRRSPPISYFSLFLLTDVLNGQHLWSINLRLVLSLTVPLTPPEGVVHLLPGDKEVDNSSIHSYIRESLKLQNTVLIQTLEYLVINTLFSFKRFFPSEGSCRRATCLWGRNYDQLLLFSCTSS